MSKMYLLMPSMSSAQTKMLKLELPKQAAALLEGMKGKLPVSRKERALLEPQLAATKDAPKRHANRKRQHAPVNVQPSQPPAALKVFHNMT